MTRILTDELSGVLVVMKWGKCEKLMNSMFAFNVLRNKEAERCTEWKVLLWYRLRSKI